jgi:SAM-dependent methyltransferase
MGRPRYAYGDSAVALKRLRLLARVFAPASEALLNALPEVTPDVVLDLGCGPGETTRLLRARFPGAGTVLGVDASAAFVDAARDAVPDAAFLVGDVLEEPLPGAPADLLYARFLLAHLPDPAAVATRWLRALAPGGLAILEEVEEIVTEDRLFSDYLDGVAASVLRARGSELYVGPLLAALPGAVCEVAPPAGDAAALFGLNLRVLRSDPAVRERFSDAELDAMAAALHARADDPRTDVIAWRMRQVVAPSDAI